MDNEYKRESVKITTDSGEIIRYKDKVDNFLKYAYAGSETSDLFGSLIKQSHILSQDQVTDFISKDDPKDRFNSLADIMGLKNILYIYENFKEIRGEVQSTKIKFEDKKKQNIDSMQLRSKDLIPIGTDLLDEIQNLIQRKPSVEALEEVLLTLEKNKLEQKQRINQTKEVLTNIEQKGFAVVLDAKESISVQRNNIRSAEEHVGKLKKLNLQVQTLTGNLTQKTDLMKEVIELSQQVNEKLITIEGYGFSERTGIGDVAQLIEPERERLSKLVYVIASKSQYQTLVQVIQRSGEIQTLKDKEARMFKKNLRLKSLIKYILDLLNDSEGGIIVTLLQDIQNIHTYVKQHDTDGKCPVCSAHHGEGLQNEIAQNINHYQSLVNKKTGAATRLLNMKSRLENKNNDISNELKEIESEISKLQLSIENAQQQIDIIKSNSLFVDGLFERSSLNEINAENERIKNKIRLLDATITVIGELEQLKNKRSTKLEELGTQFVGDLTSKAIESRQQRLVRAESRITSYIKNKQNHIKNLQNNYDALFAIISKIPDDFKEDDNKAPIESLLRTYVKDEANIGIQLQLLSKAFELKRTLQFNEKVSVDISNFKTQDEEIREQLRQCNDVLKSTKMFIDGIGGTLGTKAKDFLNTSQSLIQKYYRYLNPLPSNNVIKFDGDNGELNILIPLKDDKQFSNVKHTLSSGQLNVLAIAIFLAINQSQKISKLDFVAIDDPIQNMDDVNRFSICDVLGSLKKQLILSTHDLDFVKLFIKKNEHIKSEIQLYMLESPQLKSGKIKRIDFMIESSGHKS